MAGAEEYQVNRLSGMLIAVLAGSVLATPALAQNSPSNAESPTTTNANSKGSAGTPMSDSDFVKNAAQGGMAEIELGQLAQQKATNPLVKQFADRMVNDHGKANDQLKQLAEQKNMALPQDLDQRDALTKARLEKLSGKKFDHAYMRSMVKDHEKDVAEFQLASKNATDPAIKNFASETLPTLRDHLKEAEKIAPTTSKATEQAQSK